MQTRRYRVLCVEDHDDTCSMLTALLGSAGCEVTAAGGVAEVKRAVAGGCFDLAILDNRFADGSGVELCRWLREKAPDTPVIFYSGAVFESDKEEARSAGAVAFVAKPDIGELLDAVNRQLKGKRAEPRARP